MALQRHVVVLLFLASLFRSSYSYQFVVGWVPNPSENYNSLSQRMRFQINDSVLFKYKQGADSVLEVSKDDYDKCNTGNPIKKMEDGNSMFMFDHSGPFYFISGNKDSCDKGQKIQIVVISVGNQGKPKIPAPSTTPPATSPPSNGSSTPTTPSPMGSPPSPSGSTTPPPKTSTPSATSPTAAPPKGSSTSSTPSPNGAPISTPAGKTPTSSPTPVGSNVSPPSPATGGSLTPATSPVANGPSTNSPGSLAPAAGGPSGSIIAPAAGGPSGSISPAGGPSADSLAPTGGPPAGANAGGPSAGTLAPTGSPGSIDAGSGAPANPNSFAVKAFTPSVILVSAVSLVLTRALGEFIISP